MALKIYCIHLLKNDLDYDFFYPMWVLSYLFDFLCWRWRCSSRVGPFPVAFFTFLIVLYHHKSTVSEHPFFSKKRPLNIAPRLAWAFPCCETTPFLAKEKPYSPRASIGLSIYVLWDTVVFPPNKERLTSRLATPQHPCAVRRRQFLAYKKQSKPSTSQRYHHPCNAFLLSPYKVL